VHAPSGVGTPAMTMDPSIPIASVPTSSLGFDLPEGWTEDATPRPARLTTIIADDGDGASCELAVTRFPGDVGGELANVNRWRAQMGLDRTDSTASEDAQAVSVGEFAGTLYRFASPGDDPGRSGMLVALLEQGGSTWFFKMVGPTDALDRHRERFVAFLGSVRLPTD